MLALQNYIGQFLNFNLRAEKHGDESVPGADLKISIVTSNDILAEFHPSLKAMLFRAPEPGEMDMVDKAQDDDPHPRACASATGCTSSSGTPKSWVLN